MYRSLLVEVLWVLVWCASNGRAARILAYYHSASTSHHLVFRPLTQELLRQGHEVVVITPHPTYPKGEAPTNLTEIDVHDISFEVLSQKPIFPKIMTGERKQAYEICKRTVDIFENSTVMQLLSGEVQNILRDKTRKFDLILAEGYSYLSMYFGYIYKVPVIFTSSLGKTSKNLQMVGSPRHPIFYPDFMQQHTYNHSLLEIFSELSIFYSDVLNDDEICNRILKRVFGRNALTMQELENTVEHMFLANVHYVWDMNRPVAKNVVFIGGIHLGPGRDLPKDLKEYLDSSKHGVVYVSFGTSVDAAAFAPEKLQALLSAFARLPYDVLWKWNRDELAGRTANVRIAKWLPQADLLRHPNVKLFVFQGGLQSTDEAIAAGVPMLAVPIMMDQFFNSQQIVAHKMGLQVDLESVTEGAMTNYIHTVIDDPTYRENVVRFHKIVRDEPQASMERAMWAVARALRHGAAHVRAPAAHLHWVRYYELELLAALALLLGLVAAVAACLLRRLLALCTRCFGTRVYRLFSN